MLPSILYTAAVFDPPHWVELELRNLQKQFLWQHSTSSDKSKHKLNPGLLFTPKGAGGVGLVSIPVACKAQRLKHAMLWLLQTPDRYVAGWKVWAFRGLPPDEPTAISPRNPTASSRRRHTSNPGDVLRLELGDELGPTEDEAEQLSIRVAEHMDEYLQKMVCWREGDQLHLWLHKPIPPQTYVLADSAHVFWPTYLWSDNPWLRDSKGRLLTKQKYDKIRPCALNDLGLERTGLCTYVCHIPLATGAFKHHTAPKLGRWAMAILMGGPVLAIAEKCKIGRSLALRNPPDLQHEYSWCKVLPGVVHGTWVDEHGATSDAIVLRQEFNGINWRVDESEAPSSALLLDMAELQQAQRTKGIVFQAHPSIHGVQWSVADTFSNKHVLQAFKQQPYRKAKMVLGKGLTSLLSKLHQGAERDSLQHAALRQTPKQVWSHFNEITEYQVWVCYRLAFQQLNLYFSGRENDSSCKKLSVCKGQKETLRHIFWTCPCAQGCWQALVRTWTCQHTESLRMTSYAEHCWARSPPPVSSTVTRRLQQAFGDDVHEFVKEWKRIWWILCSVCITTLWIQRIRATFHGQQVTVQGSVQEYVQVSLRQLRALANRERRRAHTKVQGTRLLLCIGLLDTHINGVPHNVVSHVQPPGQHQTPALLTWLRKFQTSCTL